jgi:hypothetical protein
MHTGVSIVSFDDVAEDERCPAVGVVELQHPR